MSKIYSYKGNTYQVLLESSKVKIGKQWLPCIVYQSLAEGETYVREKEDFFEKFTQIDSIPIEKLREKYLGITNPQQSEEVSINKIGKAEIYIDGKLHGSQG